MNAAGHGPAWANSLFEDAAEFGLGMFLGVDKVRKDLAENLDALYDYMTRRLASVAVDKSAHSLEEVQGIILQLREGWSQIDPASEPQELK